MVMTSFSFSNCTEELSFASSLSFCSVHLLLSCLCLQTGPFPCLELHNEGSCRPYVQTTSFGYNVVTWHNNTLRSLKYERKVAISAYSKYARDLLYRVTVKMIMWINFSFWLKKLFKNLVL